MLLCVSLAVASARLFPHSTLASSRGRPGGAAAAATRPPLAPSAQHGTRRGARTRLGVRSGGRSGARRCLTCGLLRRYDDQTDWATGLIQLGIAEEQQRNKALFMTVRAAESEWLMHATRI